MGTKWMVTRNDCYIIDRVTLKPHCRVWYHFLKNSHSIHPKFYNLEGTSIPTPSDHGGMKDKCGEHYLSRDPLMCSEK